MNEFPYLGAGHLRYSWFYEAGGAVPNPEDRPGYGTGGGDHFWKGA